MSEEIVKLSFENQLFLVGKQKHQFPIPLQRLPLTNMTPIKHHQIISISCVLILLFSCGNDCKNYKPRDDYNSIWQLYRVGYLGDETLTFLRNGTDTISFTGTGKKKIITQENGNLGSCGPATIEHNDNYQYNYVSENPDKKLVIEITYPGSVYFYFMYSIKKAFASNLADLYFPFGLDEMTVNGVTYKDIELIYSNTRDTIYYDLEVGIIKFGFVSGDQWTLIK